MLLTLIKIRPYNIIRKGAKGGTNTSRNRKPYKEFTPEQQEQVRQYNSQYDKKNYKTYTIKLNVRHDADIIEYIASSPTSITDLIRKSFRAKARKAKRDKEKEQQ